MKNQIKFLIIFIVLLAILPLSLALEVHSSRLNYVYNAYPDSTVIGSKIGYINENAIDAPILTFVFDENTYSDLNLELTTAEEISVSGIACILDSVETLTWNNVMSSLSSSCSNFVSSENQISFSINSEITTDYLKVALIPNNGNSSSDILSSKLIVSEQSSPQPPEEPEDPDLSIITTCNLDSINFYEADEFRVNQLIKLNLKTSGCENSIVRLKIYEKTLTGKNLISDKQVLIDIENKDILWIPKNTGKYFFEIQSENFLETEVIEVLEYSIDNLLKNKEFFEIIGSIHNIADADESVAFQICQDLSSDLETDVCIEDLAVYTHNKNLCSKIKDENRKSSCYTAFALEGDVSGCLHSSNKANCLLIGLLSRQTESNFSIYPEKESSEIIMKEKDSNSTRIVLISLIIMAGLIFLLMNIFYEKKRKKKKKRKN